MSKKNKAPWQGNQQKETNTVNAADSRNEPHDPGQVKIKMKTDYRDVAKAGDIWETDAQKAAELVNAGRAEYV